MYTHKLVTIHQALQLKDLNYHEPADYYGMKYEYGILHTNGAYSSDWNGNNNQFFSIPTLDEVIDWLRAKHNIIIYTAVEPFIHPRLNNIMYSFKVKWCNKRDGWNGRVYIGQSRFSTNIYSAKREAIRKAISYLQKENARNQQRANRKRRVR